MSITTLVPAMPASEPSHISIVEIRLEDGTALLAEFLRHLLSNLDAFNRTHDELLHFLVPYHRILCQENIWPAESNFTSPNTSFQLIKDICENGKFAHLKGNRSDILQHLMFIYTVTSFLYVFAYCSLQTAIRHVENVIVQNMRNVCIGRPFDGFLGSNFTGCFRSRTRPTSVRPVDQNASDIRTHPASQDRAHQERLRGLLRETKATRRHDGTSAGSEGKQRVEFTREQRHRS